jgi:hypothetical protein
MKLYYATEDEMFVKKGQQVWPREEALKMMDETGRRLCNFLREYLFWAKTNNDIYEWIRVQNSNIPLCVETSDKDEFREWLVGVIGNGHIYGLLDVMEKYDQLHGHVAEPQEQPKPLEPEPNPEPKFKVGDNVVDKNGKKFVVKSFTEILGNYKYFSEKMGFGGIGAYEEKLQLAPKTKLVFSLEKWVEKRYKICGAKHVAEHITNWIKEDGKTVDEIYGGKGYYSSEPDLFVEVEDKQ